jgi:Sulfatase-modifying factor enzyme 1
MMSTETAEQIFMGIVLSLALLSILLIILQLDRFEAHKRKIAISAIAIYGLSVTAIWYIEEIKAFLWEEPPMARQARAAVERAANEGVGGLRGGASAGNGDRRESSGGVGHSNGVTRSRFSNNRFQDCAGCPEMVIIPAGDDGAPIASFALGRFELTVREFHAFVLATGHVPAAVCEGQTGGRTAAPAYLQLGPHHAGSRPVDCISWNDARAYAAWLSGKTGQTYRLPAAREWLHAARGGERPDQVSLPVQRANLVIVARPGGLSIGTSPANGYGAFDMAGNVAEWVDAQVALGGSWADGDSLLRTRTAAPAPASARIGLRIARELP